MGALFKRDQAEYTQIVEKVCQKMIMVVLVISDVTGLGRTRQKPDLDYFFQTETRTRLLKRNPKKPEPDYETRPNPKGFCED